MDVAPRLESWDARGSPAQVALGAYLDHMHKKVASELAAVDGPAGILLGVAGPAAPGPIHAGHDLDNYLYPVVRRLGPGRLATAWAIKGGRGPSSVTVGRAEVCPAPGQGWSTCAVRTTASVQTVAFKAQVAAAVPELAAGDGPVEVQMAFALHPRRNWAVCWKPTIDALGGVLGRTRPDRPFAPRDDRIVCLGLHRTLDETLGWDVAIEVRWREVDAGDLPGAGWV